MTEQWVLSDFHYTTWVYSTILIAYIRQPLCVRLRKTRRQAAVRETSAVSPREDVFRRCGRARHHWSGWQRLNVRGHVSHRSQVSMSQAINRRPQTPHEDTFQWTEEWQKALDGEQSGDSASSISKRRRDQQIQPFIWRFHPAGSYFASLYTITAVAAITEIFKQWDVCLGISAKIKLVLLNSIWETGGFHSWCLFWVQVHFLFLQRVTGWTNFYRLVG